MSELTPFGLVMRKLRLDRSLRLLDLAEKLDISAAFLSAIETGRKPIPDGFIVKVSRALDLSPSDAADLRRAADRTRKEIRVGHKKEQDRELIAAFARKLDDLPAELLEKVKKWVLESLAGEKPFQRRRRGLLVPPLGTKAIRDFANQVRALFVPDYRLDMPIIDILEWRMLSLDPQFVFDVQGFEEMGDYEGLVPIGEHRLILREDVYEGACRGVGRDRFTACHEFGHYLLHRKIMLARSRDDGHKIYCDSEWQADTFAATLLMSPRHAHLFHDPSDMASKCVVSQHAATVTWSKYLSEGLISHVVV